MIVLNLCLTIKTQTYLISLNSNNLFTILILKQHSAVKSTLKYIPLLQPLLLYKDYQNYTNLEFHQDHIFPPVGPLIMNVPSGYRNLSQISDNIPPTCQTPSPFFPKFSIRIVPTKPWCHLTSKAFSPIFLSHLL